jgi:hypothetical protein
MASEHGAGVGQFLSGVRFVRHTTGLVALALTILGLIFIAVLLSDLPLWAKLTIFALNALATVGVWVPFWLKAMREPLTATETIGGTLSLTCMASNPSERLVMRFFGCQRHRLPTSRKRLLPLRSLDLTPPTEVQIEVPRDLFAKTTTSECSA